MSAPNTLAESIVAALVRHGVQRMFGTPGGGSSLDLIDAAGAQGIEFALARTETAAAIMAAVTGELTGTPGVVLAGVGPGAASTVNGIAYAHLERAPLVLFTDGPASSLHQAFDQSALFAPNQVPGEAPPRGRSRQNRKGDRSRTGTSTGAGASGSDGSRRFGLRGGLVHRCAKAFDRGD